MNKIIKAILTASATMLCMLTIFSVHAGDGPLAYYSFDGIARDGSGNGNDGTLAGGSSYSTGIFGQAVSLDGIDGRVELPVIFTQDQDPMTVAFWVNPASTPRAPSIFGEFNHYDGSTRNQVVIGENWIQFDQYGPSGGVARINEGLNENDIGNWVHIVVVKEAEEVSFYKDSIFLGSLAHTETYSGRAPDLAAIGARKINGSWTYNNSAYNFHGLVDEVYIYDRALTQYEIKDLYNSGNKCCVCICN
uniref:Concanavalin A-like lectin/glucanases superfamily protein n=1 Tax=Candidatus Kentrum sp. LPFa TaxID=2126335 RepID=A0A450WYA6_9GAMM|nr:MAG: Concanavalin A-like lectin/glucanases superfamily protein [Candidatus Kentron sp. LPFa]